jgi:hypothetical protein
MIETAEDIEKTLVTLTAREIASYDRELQAELQPDLLAKR